jgi:DegV family protein with EDD domain
LTLRLEDREYIDDENLDIQEYLNDMGKCQSAPQTSCPSVSDFLEKFHENDNIFVVTLSSKISGTYNSAMLAKNMIIENFKEKYIHIFDSLSASVGETLVSLRINDYIKANLGMVEIVERVSGYISEMKTFFLLENIDNLARSGRISPIIAKMGTLLNIKPIMGSDGKGNIRLMEKVRGYKKAFQRLLETIGEQGSRLDEKILGIAHCNCINRALEFKEQVLKKYNFKDIIIVEMRGLTATYANNGGIVIAF